MSICNVHVTPHKALVAVDTMVGEIRDGHIGYYDGQKAMIHGDVVIAGRGDIDVLAAVQRAMIGTKRFWRIDDAIRELLGIAQDAYRAVQAQRPAGATAPTMVRGNEIVAVGWSAKQGRILASVVTREDDKWTVEDIPSYMVAPPAPGEMDLSTPVGMGVFAPRQVEAIEAVDPRAPVGGELIVYEVMNGGIIMRQMGKID